MPAMRKAPRVILLLESSRASGRSLLRGVANYARHHGPWAFYWEPRGLQEVRLRLRTLDAQGIILRDVENVEDVLAYGLPVIVVEHSQKEIPGVVNVVTDSEDVGVLAAEHLLNSDLRHFAYCGFPDKPWSQARGKSFRRRLVAAGHCCYTPTVPFSSSARKDERLLMAQWIESLPKPLGVMACNDDRAQHVIAGCKIAGFHVPDEVAVIGADNDEFVCELSDPPLSSVALDFEKAGYASAQLLDKLMRGKRVTSRRIIVPATHVVARQSTDILAVKDQPVAKALRYIREHAKETMYIADVARAAGLSRRGLEKRFRSSMGRSILKEIRRVRCEHIARLLIETNLPVAHIADVLGYESVQHIARFFRQEKNMTPLAYRKQQTHSNTVSLPVKSLRLCPSSSMGSNSTAHKHDTQCYKACTGKSIEHR